MNNFGKFYIFTENNKKSDANGLIHYSDIYCLMNNSYCYNVNRIWNWVKYSYIFSNFIKT